MRFLFINFLLLPCWVVLHAQDHRPLVVVECAGGYQATDLQWSIAGNVNEQAINVLSEVKWRALSGPLLNGKVLLNTGRRWFVGGAFSKSFIKTGTATDTDYGESNRSLPTYHAQLDSDEGSLFSYRIFGGYHLLQRAKVQLSAFAGYTERKAAVFLLNHAEEVAGQKNLRCTYDNSWKGITGGISGLYKITSWLNIGAELQYSQLHYYAAADWNLIAAFQHPLSFEQHARGFDISLSCSAVFRLNQYLVLFFSGGYCHAATGTGRDDLYLASGAVQTTQFNGAFTQTKSIAIGTRFQF
ncbi:hypothetical protein ACE38W_14420 [Chitinophaga sp. Hz27]|uniref:hypothetical protein n=1 Tax=Chitinophaga sp. Hz27 TaxID=3347169 RepID=UPI0035D7BCE4